MKGTYGIAMLLMSVIMIVKTQKVCTQCYEENKNGASFMCHGQKCDSFLWPINAPLPSNIQCKTDTSNLQQSNCYILSGLDSTKQYHKFISLTQFPASKQSHMSFTFQQQANKLIIDVEYENTKYQGQMVSHPDISFVDVKQALNSNDFKIVSKGVDSIRLKVGIYSLELKNIVVMMMNELREGVKDMQGKMNLQLQKNNEI